MNIQELKNLKNKEMIALITLALLNNWRFNIRRGMANLSVLAQLPLEASEGAASLDLVAKDLYKDMTEESISFVRDNFVTADATVKQQKLKLVLWVIEIKKEAERAKHEAQKESRNRQQTISDLQAAIRERQKASFAEMSLEEMEKQLAKLQSK